MPRPQSITLPEVPCPTPVAGSAFVYILLCADHSLYVGSTKNVKLRLRRHLAKHGAKHTSDHTPLKLVYTEGPLQPIPAIRRERQIKNWSHAKKLALINQDLTTLQSLAKGKI